MQDHRVLVVGAGVAGLAAAIDLAAAGCRVTVFERAEAPGGKLAALNVAGIQVDCGPTVLTMRGVFDDLLGVAGRTLDDVIELEPAAIVARHVWGDGATLDLYADVDRSAQAIQEAFGGREAEAFVRFSAYAARIFATVEGPFVRAQRMDWTDAMRELGRIGIGAFARIDALRTMGKALRATFRDPHLVQLFGRYATYCGSLPAEAPATLNLIAHVEQSGVHRVRGGMHRLAEALANAAKQLGVAIRCHQHVERILVAAGAAQGVRLASGETVEGDTLVFNGDVSALAEVLEPDARRLAPPPTSRAERSLSAVTWSAVGRIEGRPLVHHNVFFAAPRSDEFDALGDGRLPDEPTVYVCAQDRADEASERGTEAMLLVVNAPATGDDANEWTDEVIRRCERATWTTLERCGVSMTMRGARRTTPVDFHRRFPGTGGALYGRRTRGALAPLRREAARTRIQGLYLAGGSIHPGPGLPMATLSGRLAAQRVLEDLASTRRSRPGGTSGTTWTR